MESEENFAAGVVCYIEKRITHDKNIKHSGCHLKNDQALGGPNCNKTMIKEMCCLLKIEESFRLDS